MTNQPVMLCRCYEITEEDIEAAIANGATTINVSPSGADGAEKIDQLRLLMDAAKKAGIS